MMQSELYPRRAAMDGAGAEVAEISATCGILRAQCGGHDSHPTATVRWMLRHDV